MPLGPFPGNVCSKSSRIQLGPESIDHEKLVLVCVQLFLAIYNTYERIDELMVSPPSKLTFKSYTECDIVRAARNW